MSLNKPVGISFLHGQYATNYPLVMAGSVMAVLPLLILFAIFQKQFIEGVALQGIKKAYPAYLALVCDNIIKSDFKTYI